MENTERIAKIETKVEGLEDRVSKIEQVEKKVNKIDVDVEVIKEGIDHIKDKLEDIPCESHLNRIHSQGKEITTLNTKMKIIWAGLGSAGTTIIGIIVKMIFFV